MIIRLLNCIILLSAVTIVKAQQHFAITGNLSGVKSNRKILLKYDLNGRFKIDTAEIKNGSFQFSGEIPHPLKTELYLLPLIPSNTQSGGFTELKVYENKFTQSFFIEQGTTNISGGSTLSDAVVKGGKTQQDYLILQKRLAPIKDQLYDISLKWWKIKDQRFAKAKKRFGRELTTEENRVLRSELHDEVPTQIPKLETQIEKVEQEFIRDHPDSYVSFDLVRTFSKGAAPISAFDSTLNLLSPRLRETEEAQRWSIAAISKFVYLMEREELKTMQARLQSRYQNSPLNKMAQGVSSRIEQRIKALDLTDDGRMALPIIKKDINGKDIDWESYKGKYLLLDFWGSWCSPCRESHPHLKELYSKYRQAGFEILGVANENDEVAWKNAIIKDGLPWNQVLNQWDIKKFDAVKAYGISGYPTKILIDKEGKIVSRNFDDPGSLDVKLKEIFGF